MSDLPILAWNGVAALCWMFLFWLCSIPLRNVAIVDIAWGLGFVLVANVTMLLTESSGVNAWLLPLLTTIWGCRLSIYLYLRNRDKPEDKRYRAMREYRGSRFVYSSLWVVFGLQAVILWIVSLPVQMGVIHASAHWHLLHFMGLVLWAVGFIVEAVADYQLARFQQNPGNAGQVMNRGLWRYSRHPNYFGDFMVWWGLYVVSMAGTDGMTSWTVIGPVLITYLLMRVSGVPMLESTIRVTRPGYADYVKNTNAFFPWLPRR